ncbi:uncharacterized protein METZ01_LOCUS164869, partial [marine metagenome]
MVRPAVSVSVIRWGPGLTGSIRWSVPVPCIFVDGPTGSFRVGIEDLRPSE